MRSSATRFYLYTARTSLFERLRPDEADTSHTVLSVSEKLARHESSLFLDDGKLRKQLIYLFGAPQKFLRLGRKLLRSLHRLAGGAPRIAVPPAASLKAIESYIL